MPPTGYPALNFPPCRFRVRDNGGRTEVWDELRACWLALTPEEWVRRHLVRLLTAGMGVPPALVRQECPVSVQGMRQRADVVVFGRDGAPLLLAECKEPGVAVDVAVWAQAVRYNAVLGARFVMLTNGLRHYVYERDGAGGYAPLDRLPDLKEWIVES